MNKLYKRIDFLLNVKKPSQITVNRLIACINQLTTNKDPQKIKEIYHWAIEHQEQKYHLDITNMMYALEAYVNTTGIKISGIKY